MGGQARLLVVLVAAALIALAVWTWLPPTETTQDAIKDSIVCFETVNVIAWPEGHYGEETLSPDLQDELRSTRQVTLGEVAEGEALRTQRDFDPVRRLIIARRRQSREVVVASGGRVVLFDVRRRTLRGEVIVRAAVVSWYETGAWDAERQQLVGVRRVEETSCPIFDYAMRERGDSWKVVARKAPDGGPFFYDVRTGESGTGP